MNRRGQYVVVGAMISFMLFITVIAFIEGIKTQTTTARTALDCGNSSISTGTKQTCIVVDSYLPIYIGTGVGIAIAFFGIRESRS